LKPVAVVERGERVDTDTDDAALLRRMRRGDRDALEQLYGRHSAWLAARLRARSATADLAEEALQDTFVAAWRGAGSYRGDGDVAGWLWGIAVRRLATLARRRPVPTVTLDDTAEPQDRSAGPEDVVLGTEASARVRAAVARLPAEQRAVVEAVVYRGLSVTEAARAAEVPDVTMRTRLHRARLRIAKEFSP
jgi:RNA polymerase sigma-70 factor (ECF subfamily)